MCNTPRYRERPGGRILPLSHQTDQNQRVHGYAGCGNGICKDGTHMMITESEILNAIILIVDDQKSYITLLEQLLGEAGYTCVSSTMNPQEVCALHRKNNYDLIT